MDQLAYHRQQRDFPHDGFPPWAGKANVQLTIVIADRDLARVIAKIAQPVEVILAKKGRVDSQRYSSSRSLRSRMDSTCSRIASA
ncbi:hypothetical protein K24_21360 [Klebsiella pneumoniae]|nr:hypothetical protein K24_21360 [Klebsiella pneumoniae]